MDRKMMNTLIVNDQDLDCGKKELTLTDMTLQDVGFPLDTMAKFDLIVYSGSRGTKVLKSRAFKTGKIL